MPRTLSVEAIHQLADRVQHRVVPHRVVVDEVGVPRPVGPALAARGFHSLRTARLDGRSGILSSRPPPGVAAADLVMELRSRGVYASMPDGLFRLAPHFPSSLSEIETVLGAVDEALMGASDLPR